jgi:hypothetical protein
MDCQINRRSSDSNGVTSYFGHLNNIEPIYLLNKPLKEP